jgi:hypothetical protein
MLAIRGTYDGKEIRPLATEALARVEHEVPVAIVFLEQGNEDRDRALAAARRMRERRDAMEPLGCTVKELIEEGRR